MAAREVFLEGQVHEPVPVRGALDEQPVWIRTVSKNFSTSWCAESSGSSGSHSFCSILAHSSLSTACTSLWVARPVGSFECIQNARLPSRRVRFFSWTSAVSGTPIAVRHVRASVSAASCSSYPLLGKPVHLFDGSTKDRRRSGFAARRATPGDVRIASRIASISRRATLSRWSGGASGVSASSTARHQRSRKRVISAWSISCTT